MKLTFRIICASVIIIFLCGMNLLASGGNKRDWPSFRCVDVFGRIIDSHKFYGHYAYVHFIRSPLTPDKLLMIRDAVQEFKDNSLINIIFVLPENNLPKIEYLPSNIFCLEERSDKFHNQFGAPSCCDSFLIYNQRQELMWTGATGFDYRTEARPYLVEISKGSGVRFFDSDFILNKIHESGLPSSLLAELDRSFGGKRTYFVSLLSSICSICPIAKLINEINGYSEHSSLSKSFVVFVADDFTDIDIGNFRSAFNIGYPVSRSPQAIAKTWNRIKYQYPRLFDNLFLAINQKEEIVIIDDMNGLNKYMKATSR